MERPRVSSKRKDRVIEYNDREADWRLLVARPPAERREGERERDVTAQAAMGTRCSNGTVGGS